MPMVGIHEFAYKSNPETPGVLIPDGLGGANNRRNPPFFRILSRGLLAQTHVTYIVSLAQSPNKVPEASKTPAAKRDGEAEWDTRSPHTQSPHT